MTDNLNRVARLLLENNSIEIITTKWAEHRQSLPGGRHASRMNTKTKEDEIN